MNSPFTSRFGLRSVRIGLLLASSGLLLSSCATEDRVKDLESRVVGLEEKVKTLESKPGARAAAPAADPAKEAKAKELFTAANEAMEKGETEAAKAKVAELFENFGDTNTAKSASRMKAELEVFGRELPAGVDSNVEKWFIGSAKDGELSEGATLVVFWEVWCPHCKREVPELEATYNEYKGKGLKVVGYTRITKSSTPEKVEEFLKENKVTYPIAKENGKIAELFNVSGIPAAALVKNGKIIWRGHPQRITPDMLNKLIAS
jgi:thiol-disulfide isomerase/thioredoxin